MARILVSLAAGLLFGTGLVVSQMINPAKVLAFLDIAGAWDPSLAFVMAGAIAIAALGVAVGRARGAPICAPAFMPPSAAGITPRLVLGAAMFGAGWGLAGFCPGPALAALSFGGGASLLFVAAMLAGMVGFAVATRPATPPGRTSAAPGA